MKTWKCLFLLSSFYRQRNQVFSHISFQKAHNERVEWRPSACSFYSQRDTHHKTQPSYLDRKTMAKHCYLPFFFPASGIQAPWPSSGPSCALTGGGLFVSDCCSGQVESEFLTSDKWQQFMSLSPVWGLATAAAGKQLPELGCGGRGGLSKCLAIGGCGYAAFCFQSLWKKVQHECRHLWPAGLAPFPLWFWRVREDEG